MKINKTCVDQVIEKIKWTTFLTNNAVPHTQYNVSAIKLLVLSIVTLKLLLALPLLNWEFWSE